MAKYRGVLSCSTLVGDAVRNKAGEDLGNVEEIMINLETGTVAYVVLSFGGILGVGDKLFAVPWKAFSISEEEHKFVLDVPRERLEHAPGFDKDNWPDTSDPMWNTNTEAYWQKAM